MVSTAAGTTSDQTQFLESPAFSAGERSDLIRFICSDPTPSYVAFLTRLYGSQHTPENIEMFTGIFRESTQNQYQSVWASWAAFVKRVTPSRITKDFMVSYFCYLHKERNFSPNTIKSYKAALRDPIRLAFGLDLQDDIFHEVVRSYSLETPTVFSGIEDELLTLKKSPSK